ncbi:hypothetical protein [Pseudomarimonas arenosa]|uniref:Uncharacterized protein n=1 Tax=Pseudomarimonas arenosa TaxID=2774145 RepID=A0AAW3ZNT1_9GAMM|nr:hypothetical protein [Pseudomarimonas arenosa]MBD8526001.1 hypothetical protein [Pseudomarimonas arenosa]
MRQGLLYLSSEAELLYEVAGGFHRVDFDTRFNRLTVVADFVEEALTRVALPKMSGRDMSALVERRLQQEFRETAYRDAHKLGPGKAEKTLEYLFVGLPVAQRIDRLLKPLVDQGCAVEAVVPVSALVAHWIKKARQAETQRLIVLPTPAGIRHVFVERGQAVLSRLTNTSTQQQEPLTAAVDELGRTVQYLYNARLIERGVSLPTWVWGNDDVSKALQRREVSGIIFEDSPQATGLQDPASLGLQALFALAVRDAGPIQLAPPTVRLHHYARRLRNYLSAGTAAAVIALLALSAWTLGDSYQARSKANELEQLRTQLSAQAEQLRGTVEGATTSADNVRESILSFEHEIEKAPSMTEWLVAVSRGFDVAPAFQLNSLTWRTESSYDNDDSGIGEAADCPKAYVAGADTGLPIEPGERRTGLLLSGTVDQALSLREALGERQRFERALSLFPDFELNAQETPIDISGGGAIRGSSGASEDVRFFDYCVTDRKPNSDPAEAIPQ